MNKNVIPPPGREYKGGKLSNQKEIDEWKNKFNNNPEDYNSYGEYLEKVSEYNKGKSLPEAKIVHPPFPKMTEQQIEKDAIKSVEAIANRILEKQYFTPSIGDLRVGYECEYFEPHSPKQWEPYIFDTESVEEYITSSQEYMGLNFRTPYLTKEQIEAEGWRFSSKATSRTNKFLRGKYSLFYSQETKRLRIADEAREDKMTIQLFDGYYPSVNELRYIIKLLGI